MNTCFEKSCTNYSGETFIVKNRSRAYLWISNLKFYVVFFVVCPIRGLSKKGAETKVLN